MKKSIKYIAIIILMLSTQISSAQTLGSGILKKMSYDFKNFDAISLSEFNAQVVVEVGKPYAIDVDIDDNLAKLLQVRLQGSTIVLELTGNENGKLYLEKTNIKIKICMPTAVALEQKGNANVMINNLNAKKFGLENNGNGNVTVAGIADELEIKKDGNGSVNASKVLSKTAKVKSNGNGDVAVNSQISLVAHGRGNGDIIQYGTGKIENLSTVIGNGEVKKVKSMN